MLGKLLKYEAQATARWFLPAYGLLLIMAIANRIFLEVRDATTPSYTVEGPSMMAERFGDVLVAMATMFYVFIIAAVFIATVIIIIQRFYKNLMGDEGYLMFTLPVRAWENIASKLLVGLFWTLMSSVAVIISLLIIVIHPDLIENFGYFYTEFIDMLRILGMRGPLFIWLFIGNVVLGAVYGILHIYASVAIGQLSGNHKVLCAFGAYFGISIVENTVGSIVSFFTMFSPGSVMNNFLSGSYSYMETQEAFAGVMNFSMGLGLLFNAVLCGALFVCTNYLLSKKLNLE